jgi:NAD(P) transhydrogenase subunit beta
MNDWGTILADAAIIGVLLAGIAQFRTPRGARSGNLTAAAALLGALAVVLVRHPPAALPLVLAVFLAGSLAGTIVAVRVNMLQIPAMVAFQHGAGGVAAFLVSFVELTREASALAPVGRVSGLLGTLIGAATFSGSMIASAKLANRMKSTPTVLPGHGAILAGAAAAALALGAAAWGATGPALSGLLLALILCAIVLGVVFAIRVGGADMPVLISFLNATAGLAAAFCGIVIQNRLLIACGATVAASGSILTRVMCVAMNRSLLAILVGAGMKPAAPVAGSGAAPPPAGPAGAPNEEGGAQAPAPATGDGRDPFEQAVEAAKGARKVIIIPGYGMALAQAQFEVVQLQRRLEALGKEVKFAVHPVAGRMPGHIHVLLAEAEVDYDRLFEMKDVNAEFPATDLALVVGACDVVNPAAIAVAGTPISGMPILMAHEAKRVVVCNLDRRPGYSGVENPLYADPRTILLLGDAKATLARFLQALA